MLQKLPLDRSTFSVLRSLGYLYVDKTQHAYNLITGGHRFFLARPRRFGKSLFVSTLNEILNGNKKLFQDLWIYTSNYQWHTYGVIALDLSKLVVTDVQSLQKGLCRALLMVAESYGITIPAISDTPEYIIEDLVMALHKKFGKVALLIDEYDSPILHVLRDVVCAQQIRDSIRSFFTSVKALDAHVDFVFITGVSSFAKAGIFSGMNNLQTITLDKQYAAICGYTQTEVDIYFKDYIITWTDQTQSSFGTLMAKIKEWYNGYTFGKNVVSVYNPFSIMHAIHKKEFENFWFSSGTPSFLVEQMKEQFKKGYMEYDLENMEVSESTLGTFDVNNMPLIALMFQTGYLTIAHYNEEEQMYRMKFPNQEVELSLQKHLLKVFADLNASQTEQMAHQLRNALVKENVSATVKIIENLFAKLPTLPLEENEKFYQSLLVMLFAAAGIKTHSEYSMSHGRIDMVVELAQKLYIIEVKLNKPSEDALKQIKSREYFRPFFDWKKTIILVCLSFKRAKKHFSIEYVVEKLPQ